MSTGTRTGNWWAALVVGAALGLSQCVDRPAPLNQNQPPRRRISHRLLIFYERRIYLSRDQWALRMYIETPDNDWNHLYPDFREKLLVVFAEAEQLTGVPWVMLEGLRSPERQLWLYAQGRTRPGQVVTWMRSPKYHGTGLAADCYPKGELWNAPQEQFTTFRQVYLRHGLTNPAWGNGDRGHVQLSDAVVRQKALAWVRAGCPAKDPIVPNADIQVLIDGHAIPDADAFLQAGTTYVALRPVADALDFSIAKVWQEEGKWKAELVNDTIDRTISVLMKGNTGFVKVHDLPVVVGWDSVKRTVRIGGK